mgnify:CR=1 FL=1
MFRIEWHDRLASTNKTMKERLLAGEILPEGLVIAAREQTAGRGRFDRTWIAPPGKNLTFSVLHWSNRSALDCAAVPMAAALAVAQCARSLGVPAMVKWPNDVLANDRKLCGILSERLEVDGRGACVIGVGVNVNMTESDLSAIDQPANSIRAELGHDVPLEAVLHSIGETLGAWLSAWDEEGFAGLLAGWSAHCAWMNERVKVIDGERIRRGVLHAFGARGELILRTDAGLESIWAGDLRRDA